MSEREDHAERGRGHLWIARKMLHDGTTAAPNLREVYFAADRAHSAITNTGDLTDAYRAARNARSTLAGAAIDVEGLERWLGAGPDAEGEPWRDFVHEVGEELDAAVEALAAATAEADPDTGPQRP